MSSRVAWSILAIGGSGVAAIVWTAIRARPRSVVWRLGLRRFISAPVETFAAATAIALAVSLLFSAIGIGQSLEASLEGIEGSRLGPIDVSIVLRGPAAREGAVQIRSALAERAGVTTTTLRALQVSAVTPADVVVGQREYQDGKGVEATAASVMAEPLAIAYDYRYEELASFSQGKAYGLPESGPDPGFVYLSRDLAVRLGAAQGEEIALVIGDRIDRFRIARILEPKGMAGYSEDFESSVLSVFVPEGYLDAIPAVTEVLVNVGTPVGSSPDSAMSKAEPEISSLKDVFDSLAQRGTRPVVRYHKANLARTARRIGGSQVAQLLELGSFSVLSALGLLGTLLYLVLSERKRLFGVVSAVGMRRRDIAASNDVTALALAVPGIVLGLGIGSAVVWLSVRVGGQAISVKLSSFEPVVSIPLYLVAITASSGILVTAALSRMSSALLLSYSPAELVTGRERPLRFPALAVLGGGLALIALGAGGAAIDFRAKNPTFIYLGPALVAAGMALLVARSYFRRAAVGVLGAAVVSWIVYVEARLGRDLQPPEFGALPVIVVAVFLIAAVGVIVALIGPAESILAAFLNRVGARMVAVRTSARNLRERRGATWFVVQTSASAVAVLAMVLGVFGLEKSDFKRFQEEQLGKWTGVVEVRTSESADPTRLVEAGLSAEGVGATEGTKTLRTTQKFMRVVSGGRQVVRVYEIPKEVAVDGEEGFIPLRGRNSKFGSDREAWEALFDENPPDGRRWVIMSEGAVDLGFVSPASAVLHDPETNTYYNLAGITALNGAIPGVYAAPGEFAGGGSEFRPTTVLFKLSSDIKDVSILKARLQGRLYRYGAKVIFASEVVSEKFKVRTLVSAMLRVFLSLGVVVAIASQVAVVTRAVRARTRSLAILRALGASRAAVFASVAAEGMTMAVMGSFVGSFVGSVVAARLYARGGGSVNLLSVLTTAVWLVLASATIVGIASLLPAAAAARTYPSEVLRNPQE